MSRVTESIRANPQKLFGSSSQPTIKAAPVLAPKHGATGYTSSSSLEGSLSDDQLSLHLRSYQSKPFETAGQTSFRKRKTIHEIIRQGEHVSSKNVLQMAEIIEEHAPIHDEFGRKQRWVFEPRTVEEVPTRCCRVNLISQADFNLNFVKELENYQN